MSAVSAAGSMASRGTVSIIVPAYNAADTIEQAVRSVLGQGYGDLELIVCDDASTDDTWSRLQAFNDKRLRLLRNERNLGPGGARNRALAVATGRWVAFIDADDQWTADRLEMLTKAAADDSKVIVFDDVMECVSDKGALKPWRRLRGEEAFAACGRTCEVPASLWAASPRLLIKPLIARALLEKTGIRQGARAYGEDSEFVFRLLAAGAMLRYVPQPLYLYRIMETSVSSSRSRHLDMQAMLLDMKALFASDSEVSQAIDIRYRLEVRQERYFRFLWACKSHRLGQVLRMVLRDPWIAMELLRRLVQEVPVRLRKSHPVFGRMNK